MGFVSHYPAETSLWPIQLETIRQALVEPLPGWLCHGPYPPLGRLSTEILSELQLKLGHNEMKMDDRPAKASSLTMDTFDGRLWDALDSIFIACASLRDVTRGDRPLGPLSTEPIWFFLIKSLTHMSRSNVRLLEGASFIVPKSLSPHYIEAGRLPIGSAALFLSCVIDKDDIALPEDDRVDMSKAAPRGEKSTSSVYWFSSREAHENRSDVHSIDVPLEAHMLPGHGRRFYADIGILAVTDIENCAPMLASLLHQRRVWGINHPAIVIVPSETGTTACIGAGWMEEDAENEPIVNIAFCTASDLTQNGDLGVFDLTDPLSCFLFARFVAKIQSFWDSWKDVRREDLDDSYIWRSDNVDLTSNAGTTEKVLAWLLDLDCPESSEIPSMDSEDVPAGEIPDRILLDHSPPVSSPTMPKNVPTIRLDSSDIAPTTESAKDSKKAPSESRYSNSEYAARSAYDGTSGKRNANSCTESFLDRRVMSVAGHVLSDDSIPKKYEEEAQNINAKVQVFLKLVEFQTLDEQTIGIPSVGIAQDVEQLLDDQRSLFPNAPVLDAHLAGTIRARLEFIFKIQDISEVVALLSKYHGANETEHRLAWNFLLYNFTSLLETPVSPDVVLERTLNLATNTTIRDQLHKEDADVRVLEDRVKFIHGIFTYSSASLNSVPIPAGVQSPEYGQASASVIVALGLSGNLIRDSRALIADIQDRFSHEPTTAICDGVVCTPWQGFGRKITDALMTLAQSSPDPLAALNQFRLLLPVAEGTKKNKRTRTISLAEIQDMLDTEQAPKINLNLPSEGSVGSGVSDNQQGKRNLKVRLLTLQWLHPLAGRELSPASSDSGFPHQGSALSFLNFDLLLPLVLMENKKQVYASFITAVNQGRSYLVAALYFLESLGIVDYEVFALVTNGPDGAVIMGWYSAQTKKCYIIDRIVPKFRINRPIYIYHLATVLLRIREFDDERWSGKLDKEKFQVEFLEKIKKHGLPKWSMQATVPPKPPKETKEKTDESSKSK